MAHGHGGRGRFPPFPCPDHPSPFMGYTKEESVEKVIVHDLPTHDTIEILGVNDGHIGDEKTDETAFKGFIKHIAEAPNRYWVYNGDNINNAIKSSVSNTYNERYSPAQQKEILIGMLRPIADKCLAFVPGNHEARSGKETDCHLVWDIACRLVGDDMATKLYRENEAVIKVRFGSKANNKPVAYIGLINHGFGGGSLPGSAMNGMYKYAIAFNDVDFTLSGHVHKGILSGKFARRVIDPRNDLITLRDFCVLINGAWADYGGYASRKGFPPGTKGAGRVILHNYTKRMNVLI